MVLAIPLNGYADKIYPLLVSISPNGEPGNNQSYSHSISSNGQFVVFVSEADNLVETDQNHQADIFVRDLLKEKTELVSVSSNGKQGEWESSYPTISGDGRYVVFFTRSSLDPNDTNGNDDVYMRDRESKQTIWISKPQTTESKGYGAIGIISSTGNYIVFRSEYNALGLTDPNSIKGNLFLWDKSRSSITGLGISVTDFDVSGNGKRIIFTADRITDSMTEGEQGDLFAYDVDSRKITLISKPIDAFHSHRTSNLGAMDFEGNKIVFRSEAPNLVDNDTDGETSFFFHDMTTSKTKLISVTPDNKQFFANSHPDINNDGNFVLMQGDGSLIYDIKNGKSFQVTPYGTMEGGISGDGKLITFQEQGEVSNWKRLETTQIFVTTVIPTISSTISNQNEKTNEKSSEVNPSFSLEKTTFYVGETLKISGFVEDAVKGTQVLIVLTKPDGITQGLQAYVTKDGKYETSLILNSNYEIGQYSVLSSYNSKILGKESFSIEIKTRSIPEIVTKIDPPKDIDKIKQESKELGIASFVDKTKDPQSYVDRYNNEPNYKKWFDDNFPEYDSIEQAVGLKLIKKIPDWVKNIFGWYALDQVTEDELLNAIKYLINNKILVVN